MMTPAYAFTATERVLPRLALDFTTGVLDPRVTVTRALNTATAINSSGFIAAVNANLPRFDYDPATLAPRGLLIEEQRTNLLLRSEEFETAAWTRNGVTVSANSTTSPDGTADADTLTEDTSTGEHRAYQNVSVVNATAYAFSVYVKANGRSLVMLTVGFVGQATFDISTGVVTDTAFGTAEIQNAGNGWYRCTVRFTSATTGYAFQARLVSTGTTTSYTGDGVSGIFLWGAQLETGAFATSYIPTTTTSVTRNADVVSMTGTNFSDWYNASEGTFVADVNQSPASGLVVALDAAANASNRISLIKAATSGFANFFVFTAAFPEANITNSNVIGTGKIVGAYKANNCGLSSNGVAAITDTSVVLPTPTFLRIGARQDGGNAWNAPIKRVLYYPQRLTNAEVQAFSK